MSVSLQLPPSYRDFEIYQRVVIEAASTRQAAAEFKLSQTRIRQVVQRISQWLTDNLPPPDEATDAAYLRHAQHVAADRLSYFYSQAMDGWRAEGHVKYYNLAIRIALAQAKLPVIPGTLECLAIDAEEDALSREPTCSRSAEIDRGPKNDGPNNANHDPASSEPKLVLANLHASSPPPRDCSPAPQNNASIAAPTFALPTANPTPPICSANVTLKQSAARRAFLHPAHPAPLTADLPVTELQITPQQLGFNATPTRNVSEGSLSRRQRRRLKRKLGA